MDGIFDEILDKLTITTEKAKSQIDSLMNQVDDSENKVNISELKARFERMEKALKDKNIDELQKILKDAY